MSWELASFLILGVVLLAGFAWYERSRPPAQVVALVAALAALAIAGRIAFAAFPNVKPTTDIVILAGYALGPAPGFAVGALTALVSNFWFGQGPWTPWQMGAWGLCGIFGALLALGGRRIGRLGLAAACGFAGLAYGALLNFSLMATYGGELSLDRYLALMARALPFDIAHAIGNVVFALVAGPAMLRMLVRFRSRFEWRLRTPALAGVVLAALLLVSLPAQAEAAGVDRAADWLESVQNDDGGWGTDVDRDSSLETTSWVMVGLASTGRNPLDVTKAGRSPVDFLRTQLSQLETPGDFARTIVALHSAGVDPRSFGGRNLVEGLLKRRRKDGSYSGWPGSTGFAVIALRTYGIKGGMDKTFSWLSTGQNSDGGWGDLPNHLPSTVDVTGIVMQAMPSSTIVDRGLTYIKQTQRPNGGFALGTTGSTNAQSTAWAMQALTAVGVNPDSLKENGNTARSYLQSRQAKDGHYTYSATSDQTPIWVTGQVLTALTGKSFPVAAPPREEKPPDTPTDNGGGSGPVPSPPSIPGGGLPSFGAPPTNEGAIPPSSGVPSIPLPEAESGLEGESPQTLEMQPAAAPFEAGENPGPKPAVPIGIGLGTGGLALGGVIFFGRRFGW